MVRESDETNNTMDLDFIVAVPPKPDLVVQSFTSSPVSPTVIDSIDFKAVIKNNGPGVAGESLVKIKVGGEGTSPTYRVPRLAAGAVFAVIRTETLPVAQNYLARATADSDSTVAETDETNNEKELHFSVLPAPKPDLTILSFTIDPASPNTSDAIKFMAVVKNIGPGDSDITKLKIKVGGEGTSPTYTIPVLRMGETFTMMRTVTLPVAQNYLAQAIADCDNIIEETNEGNNSSSYSFAVTTR
jgi:subtilase family serine protease